MTTIAGTPVQLAFGDTPQDWLDDILRVARNAIDLTQRPGYAEFTNGIVAVEQADPDRVVLALDNRWAASAVRTTLRRMGYAIEGDRGNETTTVTLWPVSEHGATDLPDLRLSEVRDQYGRSVFLLDGPDGAVEQQCGSGGHNDLIVHSQHPFPRASRTDCDRHGTACWIRVDWLWTKQSIRSGIRSDVTGDGSVWRVTAEAEACMRDVYVRHVHRTRPVGVAPTFRIAEAPEAQPLIPTAVSCPAASCEGGAIPRHVDVIRDLADFDDAALTRAAA